MTDDTDAQTMDNEAPSRNKSRQIKIQMTQARYEAFAAIARAAGDNPTDFLRKLAETVTDGTKSPTSGKGHNGRLDVILNGRLDHIAECALHTQNQLARIENALARMDNGPAEIAVQLQVIEFLLRKTLTQAVAASYTDIQLWRLIADPSQRPAHGLPPAMLAEIRELARQIAEAAETEARG